MKLLYVATESRTSSPVRIPRDSETFHHPQIKNLYPCGEGAGYAGGIVSAAMDGERVAEALASNILEASMRSRIITFRSFTIGIHKIQTPCGHIELMNSTLLNALSFNL